MVKKKDDVRLTVIKLPATYPSGDIITHISPPPPGDSTTVLNIAPRISRDISLHKQVDGFEKCILNESSVSSAVHLNCKQLIVNNLSLWVLYSGLPKVYKELLSLRRDYQVTSPLHQGALDPEVEATVLLLADLVATFTPTSPDGFSGVFTEIVRQKSGRTETTVQDYRLSGSKKEGFRLKLTNPADKPASAPDEETKTCGVTFELGLSDKEKSVRDATPLPHTAPINNEGSGEIHYVPDDQDDWDDEDPDDDLDI